MSKEYYLGLDIGTNSVGWAVTDASYQLCSFKRKEMWGIRLFDGANTAAERRMQRCSRRRLERRNQRIDLLQELFAEEMAKVDATFFIRLNESRLHLEDKSTGYRHPLFQDAGYTDVEYYQEYPTIYHLRKELLQNSEPHDIRLVYLALHHIIKNRGHFLVPGDLGEAKSFMATMQSMRDAIETYCEWNWHLNQEELKTFEELLKERKYSKSEKSKKLLALFSFQGLDKEEAKIQKAKADQICKFITGLQGELKKLFPDLAELSELETTKFSFADSKYEQEIAGALQTIVPEQFYVVESMKAMYDWSILVDILADEDYLSYAKVKQYEQHKKNLYRLRGYLLNYCDRESYHQFFNAHANGEKKEKLNNYAAYIGSVKKNRKRFAVERCTEEDFYKALEKLLTATNPSDEAGQAEKDDLLQQVKTYTLLPLQRSKENSVVPKQVHEAELRQILELAQNYLPFLNHVDADGVSVSEKIISIFNFRVPYYVGPLSDRHRAQGANNWMVRLEGCTGRIYPWNFDKMVDLEQSNVAFIERMTNKCTYLIGEDVLPKHSILYQKYMVLNALNPLKLKGKPITPAMKQEIFERVFLKHTKVTAAKIVNHFNSMDPSEHWEVSDLGGFDQANQTFLVSMSSYLDFVKKVFVGQEERMAEDATLLMVEDIIKWKTIYGDDKEMLKRTIQHSYPGQLTDEQLKAIFKFQYSGWGNFSKAFLTDVQAADTETGEVFTIMKGLWETNHNLMQLLSSRFTFQQVMEERNQERTGEIKAISYDALVKELYVSPAVKRAIWQTVQIAEEIKHVMGAAPERIFIEMARDESNGKKAKKRTVSRKQHLLDLYAACKQDVRDWTAEINGRDEREFNSLKLYLYYLQKGRCMYTGETIALDELMRSNSKWDRDHIYPQSKIKDDSLDNLVLVNKTVNTKKSNELLSPEIVKKQKAFWRELLECGFLSKAKYDRLTRTTDFEEEELAGFLNRQLVETRQSSKAVKDLLERLYPDSTIVPVKAGWVSQFRQKDLCELKSRRVNDLHHAKDAYLNVVVGNVYYEKFTANPLKWLKSKEGKNYSINRVFEFDVDKNGRCIWKASEDGKGRAQRGEQNELVGGTIDLVRKTVRQNRMCYTEYSYCEKGELFAANPKHTASANIPLKAGLDPQKYGGYYSPNTAYFALVEFDGKKGERVCNLLGVPIYIANILPHKPDAFLHYCEEVKGLRHVKVLHEKIKKNALLLVDGFPLRIRGENEIVLTFKQNLQLLVDEDCEEIVRRIEKYLDKSKDYAMDATFDKLDDAMLNRLYDVLVEKLQTVYAKRPANKGQELAERRELFQGKDGRTKAVVLNEIVQMLRCDVNTKANLKEIGGTANVGNIAVSKNTVGKSKLVLVNQSITGLYENRTELLP